MTTPMAQPMAMPMAQPMAPPMATPMSQPMATPMSNQLAVYHSPAHYLQQHHPPPGQVSIAGRPVHQDSKDVTVSLGLFLQPFQPTPAPGQMFMSPSGQPYQPSVYQQPQPMYQTPPPQPVPPPQPAPSPAPAAESSSLLSETRHQQTEVRLELSKLTSKVEEVAAKVRREGRGGARGC